MNSILAVLLAFVALSAAAGQGTASSPRLGQSAAWTRADANGDGGLSREEARRLPSLERQFDAIDSNADGVISGAEVRAWRDSARVAKRASKPAATSKGVDEILRIADRDADGALSRAEFNRGLPRFASRFGRIDADGDGSLSRGELALWLAGLRGARRSRQPHQ
jgi:Ca2+-binding EF-hand superfamily protein